MPTDRQDIALDDNNDLKIEHGDFLIEPSDQQHVNHIFIAHAGEYKEHPLIGFGASRYLKKTDAKRYEFLRNLKVQLDFDGYPAAEIDVSEGFEKLKIDV